MIDQLEGQFFTINDKEQLWLYRTIIYGIEYDYNGENYYLKSLITDESDGEIWFENIYDYQFSDDEFYEVDSNYYPHPKRELIDRVFEFEWRNYGK